MKRRRVKTVWGEPAAWVILLVQLPVLSDAQQYEFLIALTFWLCQVTITQTMPNSDKHSVVFWKLKPVSFTVCGRRLQNHESVWLLSNVIELNCKMKCMHDWNFCVNRYSILMGEFKLHTYMSQVSIQPKCYIISLKSRWLRKILARFFKTFAHQEPCCTSM